jgi:ATP-dependent DNA helicase RecQ
LGQALAEDISDRFAEPVIEMTENPTPASLRTHIRDVACSSFGWERLRAGQLEAIEAAVQGRDVLAVLPTGYGKSAIYQVAGVLLDGPTVVISPLISLQADQVARLESSAAAPRAVAINSANGAAENEASWGRLEAGVVEFVFLSPEQLAKPDVVDRVTALRPKLVVVDEAHCVTAWGHDFRPDYLRLGDLIDRWEGATTIALTATGSLPIRGDIIEALHLVEPHVVTRGFDRPNLRLEVQRSSSDDDKRDAVLAAALDLPKPALLYVPTRADTDRYAAQLRDAGLRAGAYSGGMAASERTAVHEAFSAGALDVVVATSAFGMGIDKANVRSVVHAAVTDSVDDYYQQVGRAGRDGKPATAVLFYRQEDLGLRRYFVTRSPDRDLLAGIVAHLLAVGASTHEALVRETGSPSRRVTAMLSLLEDAAVLDVDADGVTLLADTDVDAAVNSAIARSENAERIDESRIEMMRGYAETGVCRRQYLLGYFGESLSRPCGNCDLCTRRGVGSRGGAEPAPARPVLTVRAVAPLTEDRFPLESRVRHPLWGEGVVMRNEKDRMTVFFDDEGYKTLSLPAIVERSLLHRIT